MTIYLYEKQHEITGLKYFGKTIQEPYRYSGSGKLWNFHIKKHGKEYIKTLNVWSFEDQEECTTFALKFSRDNNIAESKEWANLKEENGLDGGGIPNLAIRQKISKAALGRKASLKTRKAISKGLMGNQYALGKMHSEETKQKISKAGLGRKHTSETLSKLRQPKQNVAGYQNRKWYFSSLLKLEACQNTIPNWADVLPGRLPKLCSSKELQSQEH